MGPWGPPDTKLPASSSIVGFKRPVRVFSDFEGGSPKSILGKFPLLLGPTFYMDGAKSVLVPNWLLYTLGAKLTPVSNWYRCQIDSFYTLGAKLVPVPNWLLLHSWCQIDSFTLLVPNWFRCQIDSFTLLVPNWSGAKLTPVPNWLRCQIGAGAKLSSWRTIWHRSQFDTGVNLAPRVLGGQFGTKSVKESIWHRYQFGTKSVKESIWHRSQFGTGPIWHQECKRGQFGTGTNLAPGPIWHHTKGKIWNIF